VFCRPVPSFVGLTIKSVYGNFHGTFGVNADRGVGGKSKQPPLPNVFHSCGLDAGSAHVVIREASCSDALVERLRRRQSISIALTARDGPQHDDYTPASIRSHHAD